MLKLAKSKRSLKTTVAEFDARPELLHCANGVLDLRTRELLPFSADHLSTVSTGVVYEQGARDALWDSYLDTFLPDLKLQKFVQRVMGYALLEGNPERLFVIVCGGTSSGKSTLNEAVMAAMGGYARPFNLTVFCANKDEKPRADVADILHRRYVSTVEASADWHLHADQIKRVTGGDKLAARYPWDKADTIRVPAFAPYIFTNAVPTIKGRDRALDRRLMVLPFERTISPENDRHGAREQLVASESARRAVLAWLVEGLTAYLADEGLGKVPKVVRAAIEEAKFSFSDIDRFFAEMCEFDDDYVVRPAEIYDAYTRWSHTQGVPEREIVSNPSFGISLANRGYEKGKGYPDGPGTKRTWVRRGIRLREALWKP
ncbi:phage/plasmid primase, P4 family [Aeromicrobium halocynthiae]|uniref:Phage/plasmid primase, P4 family n=2 Tax=Aeromicrobium halocynthiae TaxID=560557 RepID=A0ABP5HQZ2_9ACTN